jgi:hypothetical protein
MVITLVVAWHEVLDHTAATMSHIDSMILNRDKRI